MALRKSTGQGRDRVRGERVGDGCRPDPHGSGENGGEGCCPDPLGSVYDRINILITLQK